MVGKKWQHCHFTAEKMRWREKKKSVPYKSPIWAEPVHTDPFVACLAGPPRLICWLTQMNIVFLWEKRSRSRGDKGTDQQKAEHNVKIPNCLSCQKILTGNYKVR